MVKQQLLFYNTLLRTLFVSPGLPAADSMLSLLPWSFLKHISYDRYQVSQQQTLEMPLSGWMEGVDNYSLIFLCVSLQI